MSTKMIKYEDSKVIKSGDNTVVCGRSCFVGDYAELTGAIDALYNVASFVTHTKGIAKLNPVDEYDEETGRRIASKRAERAGNREAKKVIVNAIKTVSDVVAVLEFAAQELDYRFECLKKDAE